MMIGRLRFLFGMAACVGLTGAASAAGNYRQTETGIIVYPAGGPEKAVRLEVYGDRMVRVTAAPTAKVDPARSLMVIATPKRGGFEVREAAGKVTLATPGVRATVDLANGNVSFVDGGGELDLAESAPGSFAPVTIEDRAYLATAQQFNRGTDEGLFGLGQHQNRQMNYNGEDVELAQHNIDVAVPFLVSTRGYGILWDNNSITRFGNPIPYSLAGEGKTSLKVTGADGSPGWTAEYYLGDKLALRRSEPTINYQYLEQLETWPAEAKVPANAGAAALKQRVVWTGKVIPGRTGLNRFRVYSSDYVKLFADGKLVIDRWRQSWNPWYHNFDLAMTAGKPVEVRVEWEGNGAYLALLHNDPLPEADRRSIAFASEAAKAVDYYYVGGNTLDQVIAGYRQLTGKASLMPKWAYGFWQSRQRYETQDQLLGVLREYRKRGIPLDNIVQDWNYWPEDQWGCHCFEPSRFPDPKAMVDEAHRNGAHVMISVWAKYYKDIANYRELEAVGGIYRNMVTPRPDEPTDPAYIKKFYRDWIGAGYANAFYDPYNPRARDIFSRQVIEGIGSKGFDAWWLDSDEPDFHSNLSIDERKRRMGPTALGPGAEFFNSYPLVHVEGLYDHLLKAKPDVRPFILTRSGFGGIQRAGAAVWSGDVVGRWDDLRDQISAGVNFSMSGVPHWSHDIGGYTMEQRFIKPKPNDLAEWRELNTRWFQFGAFSPIFRSHGENIKREIFEMSPKGSPTYRSMVWYDELRYRLMPYIYTVGADSFHRDGTIMRGLAMDFPADRAAWNVDDEYMFGPALLVAPVTEFKARSRDVYLPASATWYDFYSGRAIGGGQTIKAAAPYERMPLFVRAGSIVPIGPVIQHTGEGRGAPLTLTVYTGADGSFELYEDDGVSRQYLNGAFSRIPIRYEEATKTLTIGDRKGSFVGMPGTRTFNIRWVRKGPARTLNFDAKPDASVVYDGRSKTIAIR
jgi:alpha-D-xyloside xylohydrolase